MRELTLAVTQTDCSDRLEDNLDRVEQQVREAAAAGANVVLTQELFEGEYFCQQQATRHFNRARELAGHPTVGRFAALARELGVVLPVSFFERHNAAYYNSVAIVDADGATLGVYRKSHIPDGPGYQEKYYFNPGDSGFKVWDTAFGRIGVGICWDQWFPEAARCMALQGAELLLYPTAIGSEPIDPDYDSSPHWRTAMCGHAAVNLMPLAAANRIGAETLGGQTLTFYGRSFIADETGAIIADAPRDRPALLTARFDLDRLRERRAGWGLFRDRRPELYGALLGLDGGAGRRG